MMEEVKLGAGIVDVQKDRRSLRPRESLKRTSPFLDDQNELDFSKASDHHLPMPNNLDNISGRVFNLKRKLADSAITIHNTPKKPRASLPNKNGECAKVYHELSDVYCWECHRECVEDALDCSHCPRTFHAPCALIYKNNIQPDAGNPWTCPVCLNIAQAENPATKSEAMQQLSKEDLASALNFALHRMKHSESTAFHLPVPHEIVPDYYDVIFHPMDLSVLETHIKENRYWSTESFSEDAKWLLHNSVIYNGLTSRYTTDAKLIMKICKHEVSEIELCPDCYLSSCLRKDNWFTEPCTHPHCLVWAKMKGFPYWPAKALRISNLNVDVRFFGAHDRAWIPLNQVFLLSKVSPTPVKNVRKFQFDKAMTELELHLEKLKKVPNLEFNYAPFKTELKAEHLLNCPELFGPNLPVENPNRRPLSSAETSFTTEMNVGVHCQDNARRRHFSTTSSTTNSETTMVNESFEQPSSKLIKSPSTTIVLSRKLDKTYSVKRKDGIEDKTADEEHEDEGKADEKLINNNEVASQPTNSEEECLSVFDKMDMILKDGKAAKDESETEKDDDKEEQKRKEKVVVGIGKRPIVEKTALSALQLSRKLIKAKTKFSSPRRRNGLVSKPNTTLPSKQSPRNVSRIGHCRKIEISKPVVVKAESSQKPSNEKSTSKPKNESSKDIKRKTLLSVLARMSNGGGLCLKPILHRLPEKAVDKNDDDDKAKNNGKREPVENRNNGNIPTNYANKSVMIEKFVERITTALSSSLTDICNEIYRNAASLPRETSDQPCCSNDLPLTTEKLPSKENEDKLWFYKDAISSMSRNTEIMFSEMERLAESEKANSQRTINEMRERFEEEKAQAIKETKLKQWCASCGKEAVFYCCWNTSYCNYPCQQLHWPKHQSTCAQIRQNGIANDHSNQLPNKNFLTPTFSALPPTALHQLNVQQQQQPMANMASQSSSTTSNVLPLYAALPTANYYKTTAVPANVTLDINSAVNGQPFLAIPGSRHTSLNGANVRPTAAYLALRRP